MSDRSSPNWPKWKERTLILAVPLLLALSWLSVSAVNHKSDEDRLAVICAEESHTITVLKRLNVIAGDIGLPEREIPESSPECSDVP